MVVWDLREEVVYNMCSYVMVDVVYPSIVAIKCGEAPSQVTPFLHFQRKLIRCSCISLLKLNSFPYLSSVPRKLVVVAVVMQVGD